MQSKLLNNDNYENFISIISPITLSAKLKLRMELFETHNQAPSGNWPVRHAGDSSKSYVKECP